MTELERVGNEADLEKVNSYFRSPKAV